MLVHCYAGQSRSAALVIAYLMATQGMGLMQAWAATRVARPRAQPNAGGCCEMLGLSAAGAAAQVACSRLHKSCANRPGRMSAAVHPRGKVAPSRSYSPAARQATRVSRRWEHCQQPAGAPPFLQVSCASWHGTARALAAPLLQVPLPVPVQLLPSDSLAALRRSHSC